MSSEYDAGREYNTTVDRVLKTLTREAKVLTGMPGINLGLIENRDWEWSRDLHKHDYERPWSLKKWPGAWSLARAVNDDQPLEFTLGRREFTLGRPPSLSATVRAKLLVYQKLLKQPFTDKLIVMVNCKGEISPGQFTDFYGSKVKNGKLLRIICEVVYSKRGKGRPNGELRVIALLYLPDDHQK